MRKYIDFNLMEKYPNKYDLTPMKIKELKVKGWDKLKKKTWFNKAMNQPCWCHLEGCNLSGPYDDKDEFWIGFYENGKVDYHFSARDGMYYYYFKNFYDINEIENKFDMNVQANALKYLNMLLDECIVYFE